MKMPVTRRETKTLGPAVCDALHFASVEALKATLNIGITDSRCNVNLISEIRWQRLKADFGLPATTNGGVDLQGQLSLLLDVYEDLVEQDLKQREFAKIPLRRKREQLGAIARPLKSPRRMPSDLYPEVVSLLSCRLAIYRRRTDELSEAVKEISIEIRQTELVTLEIWLAANEVRILGALRRERVWLGGANADTAGRLLISHLANLWRFGLDRNPALGRYDSRKLQHKSRGNYSAFVNFVHACFSLAGTCVGIDAVYHRVEDVLSDMYAHEVCGHGCGFNVIQKDLPRADELDAAGRNVSTIAKYKIGLPTMTLIRGE
jgi:hypothetical protein